MRKTLLAHLAALAIATPAQAVTVSNGVVIFNQADAIAGNVTPGDAPGFPVTISASGSYRLSGNLAPTSGTDGIDVTAPEVTLDLFGFRIAGSGSARTGIVGRARGLTVQNGTVRGFTLFGISGAGDHLIVKDMRVADNVSYGINTNHLIGGATIKDSEIFGNDVGIYCFRQCHIESNLIHNNLNYGVYLIGTGGAVISNTIYSNGLIGIQATSTGIGSNTISDHTASIAGNGNFILSPNGCLPAC